MRKMQNVLGQVHDECPDCRGECVPVEPQSPPTNFLEKPETAAPRKMRFKTFPPPPPHDEDKYCAMAGCVPVEPQPGMEQAESPAPMSAREFYEKVWSTREEVEKRPRHEQLLGTLDAAFNFAKSFAAQSHDELVKRMVERFLQWKLPDNFSPDGGISFKKMYNEHTSHPMKHEPVGTNLLDYTQAEQMVRYMLAGEPQAIPEVEKGNQ